MTRTGFPLGACLAVVSGACLALLALAAPASAQEGDGVYGRFDHGLVFSLGAGVSWTPTDDMAFNGDLRARIVDSAGPYLSVRAGGERLAVLIAGVEIRPFFPALFLLDLSTGNQWVDLFVQSIGVELGAAFFLESEGASPRGTPLGGVSLSYGFSVEFPLVYSRRGAFDGMALRVAARKISASPDYLGGPNAASGEWNVIAGLTIDLGVRFSAGHGDPSGYRPR